MGEFEFMDLLYSRYASPFEFMSRYIRQQRFGEFVSEILRLDSNRRRNDAEKENDDRLWSVYIRTMSDKSFAEWKKTLHTAAPLPAGQAETEVTTREDINTMIRNAQGILNNFVPEKQE